MKSPGFAIYTDATKHKGLERVGIFGLFRRKSDEVRGAAVLVCALDTRFEDILKVDSEIYGQYYRATTTIVFPSLRALLERLEQNYDVVHLMADVSRVGTVRDSSGNEITGTELMQHCCEGDVKLLWVASDNPTDRYIQGFKARGKRLNLVMTLKRNGPNFPSFLQKMLSRMAYGDTMPVAWNDIYPQIPGADHKDSPETIFFAGRGGVRLLA